MALLALVIISDLVYLLIKSVISYIEISEKKFYIAKIEIRLEIVYLWTCVYFINAPLINLYKPGHSEHIEHKLQVCAFFSCFEDK